MKSFGQCLKESATYYFKGVAKNLKWWIPASAGIIVLGAVALKAAEDPDEDPDNEEEVPDEEPNEEESVDSKMDENLSGLEKSILK